MLHERSSGFSMTASESGRKVVYVTGGDRYGLSHSLASCEQYDVLRDRWTDLPDLQQGRRDHGSCHLSGSLYVFFGGGKNAKLQQFVEKLDMRKKDGQREAGWE